MKSKLFIMAALCAIAFTTNAQTEKGKFLLGGSANFSSSKNENSEKKTTFGLAPRAGYFVSDNWAVGTTLSYSISKTRSYLTTGALGTGYQTSSYGISPFVRYYTRIADNFKFYGDFNVGTSKGTQKRVDENGKTGVTTNKLTTYSTGISPGLVFFPAKKWAIEFQFPLFSYYSLKDKLEPVEGREEMTFKNDAFFFGLSSFSPSIGVNYHF